MSSPLRSRTKNELGNKYGRLSVVEQGEYIKTSGSRRATWICLCECGQSVTVRGIDLRNGHTQSCGCLHRDIVSLPEGDAHKNRICDRIKWNARQRNLKFELSKDEILELCSLPCYYCGAAPQIADHNKRHVNGLIPFNGIDRVDNNEGYILKNVVPCCSICNRAKRTLSAQDFYEWIEKVYKYSTTRGK